MPRFEEPRTANAPAGLCWEVLTDAERTPDWLTIASRVDAQGPPGVGQRLAATGAALGVTVHLDLTVRTFEPPHAYGWELTEPVPVDVRFQLHPADEHTTRLHTTVDVDLGRRVSMRTRLAVRVLRGETARSLDRLVGLVEAQPLP